MKRAAPDVSPFFVVGDRVVPAAEAAIAAWDPGVLTGEGLFETMLVRPAAAAPAASVAPAVVDLEPHLDRLTASAAALGLHVAARATLRDVVVRVVAANADYCREERALRLMATPMTTWAFLRPIATVRQAGLHLYRVAEARALPRHKTLAWFPIQRLHKAGSDPRFEGAFLSLDGLVLEGHTTNLWAVIDGIIHTAPTSLPILPGVTRARALAALTAAGHEVVESPFDWDELAAASEVFATSSTLPVAPVIRLEDGPRLHEGPVTRALRALLG